MAITVHKPRIARQPVHTALIPIPLENGNEGRGGHWRKSAKRRDEYELELRVRGYTRKPFPFPVCVHVTRVMGPGEARWDYSSIGRGNWKEIEDALVALGWFHDDSAKYIRDVRFFQHDSDRHLGPKIWVEVFRSS